VGTLTTGWTLNGSSYTVVTNVGVPRNTQVFVDVDFPDGAID